MIIIVGAGPAGLATAYYLEQRGLPYQVLEREAIGYAWRNHYDSLHLNTLKHVSALPGLPMPEDYPDFPSAAQFVAYLESYVHHFDLQVETGVEVLKADYDVAGFWRLETNRGERRCATLVVATGIWTTPFVPHFGGEDDFAGEILLAKDYRNPEPFAGKRVLIVGLGNSAADIAVELGMNGAEVGISIRDGAYFIEKARTPEGVRAWTAHYYGLPEEQAEQELLAELETFEEIGIMKPILSPFQLNPVVGFALPEAVKAGHVTPLPCLESYTREGVRFVDGSEAPFDVVIIATGYRPTVDFVRPHFDCNRQGYPELRGYCSTLNTHLYAIGFDYPVFEGFLQSLSHVAHELVDQIVAEEGWIAEARP